MAVIDIKVFGGEMPAKPPRALPADAAQTHSNLLLGATEFRPLAADSSVATGLTAGLKSLYRDTSSTAWVRHADERSYVRDQINDDYGNRTFYSKDDGSEAYLRWRNADGSIDRQLGVPAPAVATVATTVAPVLYLTDLAEAVRLAIGNMTDNIEASEPASRFSGTTIYGGPFTAHSLLFPTNATVIAAGHGDRHWNLYAYITVARATAMHLDPPRVGAIAVADTHFLIPITCMPYTYRQSNVALSTSLPAIENPRTEERALSDPQVTAITNAVELHFDPGQYATTQRAELDKLVMDFYWLCNDHPVDTAPTPPTEPVKPTVAEYFTTSTGAGESGMETITERDPEWIDYDADMADYRADVATYEDDLLAYNKALDALSGTIRGIQDRAVQVVREIESIGQARWNSTALTLDFALEQLYALGNADALPNVDAERVIETRFYVTTFVSDIGEESALSSTSAAQEVSQYDTCTITRPSIPSSRGIAAWRIYRSNTGSQSTAFQFVAELDLDGDPGPVPTNYVDTVADEDLGEVAETLTWLEPPIGLRGLIRLPNGVMAAFKGNTVYFCEPYKPYAWPVQYRVAVEHAIVGLALFGQTIFVGTIGAPEFISGADPASMSAQKADSNQSCVSRRGIAAVQGGVLFPSPDGLCAADGSGIKVVTRDLFSRKDWQALVPANMIGVEHEGIYHLFGATGTGNKCLTYDMATGKLGRIASLESVTAVFVDREADELHVIDGTIHKKVFGAEISRTGKWKTPRIVLPQQAGFAWLKVMGDQTEEVTATVRWYAEGSGSAHHTATITSTEPVRLPAGRFLEHEVEVESAARITRVTMVSSTQELQAL